MRRGKQDGYEKGNRKIESSRSDGSGHPPVDTAAPDSGLGFPSRRHRSIWVADLFHYDEIPRF